uniref:C2H2-type domain-containing protein n=1 Tax=Timema monikensis TaxID=170555 RepID=A0A7R9EDZ5_9NEOP|nr:unnamed protein product [Timema monikensis]
MPTYLGYGPMPNACNMFKATRLPSVAMIQENELWGVPQTSMDLMALGVYMEELTPDGSVSIISQSGDTEDVGSLHPLPSHGKDSVLAPTFAASIQPAGGLPSPGSLGAFPQTGGVGARQIGITAPLKSVDMVVVWPSLAQQARINVPVNQPDLNDLTYAVSAVCRSVIRMRPGGDRTVTCKDCGRWFTNQICFGNHKRSSFCRGPMSVCDVKRPTVTRHHNMALLGAHRRGFFILHVGNGREEYVLGQRVDDVVKAGDTTNVLQF